ncbi:MULTISPECIES: hypothetical protein [Streptomyces]|uniref:Uncharacterized protein n=1 Tax=Streptomyces fimbriatus TaxID=68197 RepID=A0ABW0DH51_STRFI
MAPTDAGLPAWPWHLSADLGEIWSYPFMVNALLADAAVAVLAGVIGWFMAMRLTARTSHALILSAVLAVAEMWAGLGLSYAVPKLPPSFAIMAAATVVYAAAVALSRRRSAAAAVTVH